MITFRDLKVGDKVIFSDDFCKFEELIISKIETKGKILGRAQIYCEGGMSFYVVLKQCKSHSCDSKDGLHCGHIYTCREGYKNAVLTDLTSERKRLIARLDEIKKMVENVDKSITQVINIA